MKSHLKLASVALFGLSLISALGSSLAHANPRDYYLRKIFEAKKNPERFLQESFEASQVLSETFDQLINPADPKDTRTFKQRYFYDSSLASGVDAPVFFFICGEGTCSAGDLKGVVREFAKTFKAHLIALEHRYYGKSQPFNELTSENLKFLKTEFALSDLVRFKEFAIQKHDLYGKWVVFGGSYPGALSAYARAIYPDHFVGSLASSAPVKAKENFEEYDLHVSTVLGPECAGKVRSVVAKIESSLDRAEEFSRIKELFGLSEIRDPIDVFSVIADMGAISVQYGRKERLCQSISSGSSPLEGYARAGKALLSDFGLNPVQIAPQGAESLNPDDYLSFAGMRQWAYQVCTEFGFFQNAYHDSARSARSHLLNMDYQRAVCKRLFGITTPVQVEETNRAFYEPIIALATSQKPRASHIFFTNGSTDPWSLLSLLPEQAQTLNPELKSYLIPGASHCEDLGLSGKAEVKKAQKTLESLIRQWLN